MISQEILNVIPNLIILIAGILATILCVWPKNSDRVRWIAGILMIMAFTTLVVQFYWADLRDDSEPLAVTIRNVTLAIATITGVIIAIWRSSVAERQADTAQQSLLNERYQQGAEMLGSGILTVRLGGIYALQSLAEDYPKQYHVQAMKLLSTFVRTSARREDIESETVGSSRAGESRAVRLLFASICQIAFSRSPDSITSSQGSLAVGESEGSAIF